MRNGLTMLHPEGEKYFNKEIAVKELVRGLQFAEGPVWHPDGYLLLSDIPGNRIFMLCLNGVMNTVLNNSGGPYIVLTHLSKMIGSNGLAIDEDNNIIICQHGNHSIAKLDAAKNCTVLCSSYNGRPLNSPNDITLKSNGAIYFTDPPYGLKNEILNPALFQPHAGVYKFEHNKLTLLADELGYPNGICFSKDEQKLFVSNSDPDDNTIYEYSVNANGNLLNKKVFAQVQADGIKVDENDNLYAATPDGVVIFSANGERLAAISLPGMVTNICFGGNDSQYFFITTPSSVLYVENLKKSIVKDSTNKLVIQPSAKQITLTNEKVLKQLITVR